MKKAPSDIVRAISDISNTILYGDLPLATNQRQRLGKSINLLKQLALKRNSLAKKRKIISSQIGGNILGVIWNVIKNLF